MNCKSKVSLRLCQLAVSLLFAAAVCILICFQPVALAKADDDLFADWSHGAWQLQEIDGGTVLCGNENSTLNILNSREKITADTLTFEVCMTASSATADGNIGVAYQCTNGYQYFCEYNVVQKTVGIRRIGNGTDKRVSETKPYSMEMQTWYRFKLSLHDDIIEWHINDALVFGVENVYEDSFSMGSYYIQGFYVTPMLRNLVLRNADGSPVPAPQVYDFEFTNRASVTPFTAQNGSVSYADGALCYTIDGADSELVSPYLNVAVGDAYSARISIRNTIFVRMKNNTSASAVRVYFKTNEDADYSEKHARTFDIRPNSDYCSYYFNLSALSDSTGFITDFKFVPVGAQEGHMYIDAILFEREKTIYEYAAQTMSCTADGTSVTVSGTLKDEYANKSVKLYEIMPENYTESVEGLSPIARAKSEGTAFTVKVPYTNGNVTRLSSLFIATVDGVKLSDRFMVENYRDFTDNPYAFALPEYSVNVTDAPFNALGDAFTDDTSAIQAAIDHVSAHGGGTVVVPGEDSFYGRRYIATNIKMKNNVELCIETGAVIWQSPRMEDYAYDVVRGHDVYIPGVNWTSACSCHNYPLIQGDRVKNVKITGGGMLRCVDTGGDNLDTISGISIWTGCTNRIHIIPIGFWRCENVEVSDITLARTNNYHINMRTCKNVYIANTVLKENTCAGGDGISATVGTKNMIIDRCVTYVNDDAVTICSTYNDPRGLVWWKAQPGADNCIDNLIIRHSNIYGGHGITFITWGTDAPNLSLQEIKNVEVYDCVLNGTAGSVGSWADNPYYGEGLYDGSDGDDFSPVKQIRIHDNNYRGKATIDTIRATDFISDCGIRSAAEFENGDFERVNGKGGWISGLSNWSTAAASSATEFTAVIDEDGYAGKIVGNGTLYQGLYMAAGRHTFTADVKLISGRARLYAQDAATGELLASSDVQSGNAYMTCTLEFACTAGKTVYLGIEVYAEGTAFADNFSVTGEQPEYKKHFEEDFESLSQVTFDFSAWERLTQDGNHYISMMAGGGSFFTDFGYTYDTFDMLFNLRIKDVVSTLDGNVGVSYCRLDANTQYYLEYNSVGKYLRMRKFTDGAETSLGTVRIALEKEQWYTLGLRVLSDGFEVYLDGEKVLSATDIQPLAAGKLMLCTYNTAIELDNVSLAENGTLQIDKVMEPKGEIKTYTLTFDADGGNLTPAAQTLTAGAKPDLTLCPQKEGYTFVGWKADGNMIESDFVMPDRDVHLQAVYKANADATSPETPSKGMATWVIVVLCVAGLLVLGGGATVAVVFVKRRSK